MLTLLTKTNISLYTVPVSWILCLLPRFYAAHLFTSTTRKPLDIILPRGLAARAGADEALTKATRDRIIRAEAAQANGLENVGYFAAAVVAGNMAGLSKGVLNALSVSYLISRGLYNYIYVVGETKKLALVRTGVFFAGQGMLFTLFIMAGNLMRRVLLFKSDKASSRICRFPLITNQTDHSSFDPASLLIIEKLNQVLDRLPGEANDAQQQQSTSQAAHHGGLIADHTPSKDNTSPEDDDNIAIDSMRVPSAYSSVEQIFTWPIFNKDTAAQRVANTIFATQSSDSKEDDNGNSPPRHLAFNTNFQHMTTSQNITQLVERFMSSVHSKIPFLDPSHLRRSAIRAEELGPAWDSSSCLVLLACALGSITTPFDPEIRSAHDLRDTVPAPAPTDWVTADGYHDAARRRFGLLSSNVEAAQCHVLSGIYFLYKLQPLQAGFEFQLASTTYLRHRSGREALLRLKGDSARHPEYSPGEQRIFWTCLHLESQLLSEIDTPKSGISERKCQDLFPPAPPLVTARVDGNNDPDNQLTPPFSEASSSTPGQALSLTTDKTATWHYYITEISLRRLINRILNTFYVCGHQSWNTDTAHWMVEQAGEFEEQLESWLFSLPETLHFFDLSSTRVSADEHRCALRQRYVHICTLMYRPFLYLTIQHSDKLPPALAEKVLSLAYRGIGASFLMSDGIGMHHRYEGTWYACRLSGVQILIVAAAKRAGLLETARFQETGYTQFDWERSLIVNKHMLDYWAQESADVAALRDEIRDMELTGE
ncbi:hypothetical protein Q7P37_004590 [Cladosporium fusiforme]